MFVNCQWIYFFWQPMDETHSTKVLQAWPWPSSFITIQRWQPIPFWVSTLSLRDLTTKAVHVSALSLAAARSFHGAVPWWSAGRWVSSCFSMCTCSANNLGDAWWMEDGDFTCPYMSSSVSKTLNANAHDFAALNHGTEPLDWLGWAMLDKLMQTVL